MEALGVSCFSLFYKPTPIHNKTNFNKSTPIPGSCFSSTSKNTSRSTKVFTSLSSSSKVSPENVDLPEAELETETPNDKFEWFSQWYPVMPVCELDKRVPLAKKILGLDVVVWWDRNESIWKVFDDTCPHRLAPLSQGRIDQWGRLQCVYHGWCFNGSGDCKFVPQATPDGPPIHTLKKACARVYPTTVQHETLWFWPSTDPKYKDIIKKKKPPFIPEMDDPSFTNFFMNRDFPYGYEVLVENLMDPAHVPYAHYGIMQLDQPPKEGGKPLQISVKNLDVNGFVGRHGWGSVKFTAPCIFCMYPDPVDVQGNGSASSTRTDKILRGTKFPVEQSTVFFFFCVPVSPDALVVGFRRWLNKYAGCQVNWGGKFSGTDLPPTPPKEQLMDRYRSHVVNCRSCSSAYKALTALEVILQIVSIVSIGFVTATKQSFMSTTVRTTLVTVAVVCFAASRWLAHFIYKNFHYHDYNHAIQ
ncbi:hypothetical protein EZV62_007103 [Acer yangbiense]|uniref:Rieske domain-containing protein n=1 Tax=Acer yangbiense TaxID=1000413 RepID=A0A5C7I9M2_9ROSI|nr:hypothetical protein EZV62_007103 [Acer yangbiense]